MWEYTTEMLDGYGLGRLDELGAQGWEAVGVSPIEWTVEGNSDYTAHVTARSTILLKRKLPE
jgi:hypothetical protein